MDPKPQSLDWIAMLPLYSDPVLVSKGQHQNQTVIGGHLGAYRDVLPCLATSPQGAGSLVTLVRISLGGSSKGVTLRLFRSAW